MLLEQGREPKTGVAQIESRPRQSEDSQTKNHDRRSEIDRALRLLAEGYPVQSEERMISLLHRYPASEQVNLAYAIYLKRSKQDPAIVLSQVKEVLDINPNNKMMLRELTQNFKKLGELDKGMAYLESLLGSWPEAGMIRLELARLYRERGRYKDAVEIYEDAVVRSGVYPIEVPQLP